MTMIAREVDGRTGERGEGVTAVEFARDRGGVMPRMFGVNHHPEIVDREHIMTVLEGKRERGEVSESWYRERVVTLRDLFTQFERESRLTSEYTLLGPLRSHLGRMIEERTGQRARTTETVARD